MKINIYLTAVFLPLFSALASAQDVNVGAILGKLEDKDKTIMSLQFKVKQEINYSLTNEKQVSEAEVIFKKPSKMYFKQTSPSEQLIVTNSKRVWVYVKAYNQVISDSWSKWIKSSVIPRSLLNFSDNWSYLRSKNTFELLSEDSESYLLVMTPNEKSSWQMKFWISKKDYLPVKTMLIAENVTITTMISDYLINPKVEKKVFEFKVPPGAEVINNL